MTSADAVLAISVRKLTLIGSKEYVPCEFLDRWTSTGCSPSSRQSIATSATLKLLLVILDCRSIGSAYAENDSCVSGRGLHGMRGHRPTGLE